ncbi:MAG: oligosaccharide flippase family protein [Ardenticatenaceae bacterium]|nr:oligosaccharide flippase family protein [Ardenticatenaceae bacterium]MCB8987051.1 oligosaccharide flippase family protein [Ardenticatenaceae bacterium]
MSDEPQTDDIANQTVRGSIYSLIASVITLSLGFVRFILLLKLLLPDDFGVVTQALFFVTLASLLRLPGLDLAYIQRPDTDEADTRAFFSLRMVLMVASLLLMAALTTTVIGPAYPGMPDLAIILLALLAVDTVKTFNSVQEAILRRDLVFRAVSGADILSAVTSTIVAPYMAWQGYGAWSLVGEQLSGQLARTVAFWGLFSRPWWPRLGWKKEAIDWYWRFSIKLWNNAVLTFLLDRFDDFWIGRNLGQRDLGYYSRAYEFANYPRRVIANPILLVFYSTFARLQADRLRLSRAFFRATSLMVRSSFYFSLLFVLPSPEYVALLGDKWLPMLRTFQLMIIYTLLDPLSLGASNLLIALGYPGHIVRTRVIQVVFFVPAVILLGSWQGIEGVALAADFMVMIGVVILFWLSHRYVDYSARRLWFWPVVALGATTAVVLLLGTLPAWQTFNIWVKILAKLLLITLCYGGILWLVEREQIRTGWNTIWTVAQPMVAAWQKRTKSNL